MPDQKPTFNIMDLVAAMGRKFQNPFGYPTQAQQSPARPTPAPTPTPEPVLHAGDIYNQAKLKEMGLLD